LKAPGRDPYVDTTSFTSSPAALAIDLVGSGQSWVYRDYASSVPSLAFAASIRVEGQLPPQLDLIEVRLGDASHSMFVTVFGGGNARLTNAYDKPNGPAFDRVDVPTGTFTANAWVRVSVTIAADSMSLRVGSVTNTTKLTSSLPSGGKMTLIAGVTDMPGANGGRVLLDDYVADW
jgi:hypothetical protein